MRAAGKERTPAECPLSLDTRDRAALKWVRERSRAWQTRTKRLRKYAVPQGANFTPQEPRLWHTLLALERVPGKLLGLLHSPLFSSFAMNYRQDFAFQMDFCRNRGPAFHETASSSTSRAGVRGRNCCPACPPS